MIGNGKYRSCEFDSQKTLFPQQIQMVFFKFLTTFLINLVLPYFLKIKKSQKSHLSFPQKPIKRRRFWQNVVIFSVLLYPANVNKRPAPHRFVQINHFFLTKNKAKEIIIKNNRRHKT
jgi:hypothetical protein